MQTVISDDPQESRKTGLAFQWMLWIMERAGSKNSNVKNGQFWHGPTVRQHNQSIELSPNEMLDQKLKYLHMNPVVSGFVNEPEYWKYSSAIDYAGGKGLLSIKFIE
ncbi:MAG: transposase [Cyclobacteriaceae bacterium]